MKCTKINHNNNSNITKDTTVRVEVAIEETTVEEEVATEEEEEEVDTITIITDKINKDQELPIQVKTKDTKVETEVETNQSFNFHTSTWMPLKTWRVKKEPNLWVTPSSV